MNVDTGDVIVYRVEGDSVALKDATPLDVSYLAAVEATLDEWASSDDDRAFHDL